MKTLDKQELLDKIEKREFARLDALTPEQLKNEYLEWFSFDESEITAKDDFFSSLLYDFMEYRKDSGVEELQELLEQTS